jgi:hypothetical protein
MIGKLETGFDDFTVNISIINTVVLHYQLFYEHILFYISVSLEKGTIG